MKTAAALAALRALGHDSRLAAFRQLVQAGPDGLSVGELRDRLELPPATTLGGIVRGDTLRIAHHDAVIEPGDHVILCGRDKREMAQGSALFQTGATWL